MRKLLLVGLMLLTSITTFAQVSGKVFDANTSETLPGATILIDGTSVGVVSGFDGTFSIDAKSGDTLVISYLGYTSFELLVSDITSEYNIK
jgi:hypothetical protein